MLRRAGWKHLGFFNGFLDCRQGRRIQAGFLARFGRSRLG
jgi:hypothetical protein